MFFQQWRPANSDIDCLKKFVEKNFVKNWEQTNENLNWYLLVKDFGKMMCPSFARNIWWRCFIFSNIQVQANLNFWDWCSISSIASSWNQRHECFVFRCQLFNFLSTCSLQNWLSSINDYYHITLINLFNLTSPILMIMMLSPWIISWFILKISWM